MMFTVLRSGNQTANKILQRCVTPLGSTISSNENVTVVRFFSSNPSKKGFRPRRRSSPNYRPITETNNHNHKLATGRGKAYKKGILKAAAAANEGPKFPGLSEEDANLDVQFGPLAADTIRELQRRHERMAFFNTAPTAKGVDSEVEENLRMMDYFLAAPGSTEDLVGERRALAMDMRSEAERDEFLENMERMIEEQQLLDLGIETGKVAKATDDINDLDDLDVFSALDGDEGADEEEDRDPDVHFDPNQLVHGDWSEMLVQVDRNVKLWRGGRLESYRALVVGGNLNGCGGFAVGKSPDPLQAVEVAARKCKRNIFFVDRYQGNGITRDLVGKQNSCRVMIRATDNGLRGNPLVREILKRFGITNAVAKSHGNRSPFNVVRATFKALMTHESVEQIAMKRGKRIMSVDRALRLGV